jgi:hypothetical protein
MTNRLIADARLRIEIQKVQISQLTQKTKSTRKALARRRQFEVELQFLEDQRSVILERVRAVPLACGPSGRRKCGRDDRCYGTRTATRPAATNTLMFTLRCLPSNRLTSRLRFTAMRQRPEH